MKPTTSPEGQQWRTRQMGRLAALASLLAGCSGVSRAAELPTSPAILQQMRSFSTMGSVLYIAAHPDDENTQVITYLARGRGYRTAYLSLTRGDGGQNVLGSQLGEQLGVARTQELLAARRLDGGRQYFTRAKDFGFPKDYQESLRIWERQAVLADIVRVIRSFRPDVILTRFSPQPGNTHGHHTASTVLAIDAFRLAGDPRAFPEQLGELTPWRPTRILHNVGVSGGGAGAAENDWTGVVHLQVDGNDPVLGESFASIAARSRAMHKTQGFDMGTQPGGWRKIESFLPLGGEPATQDILDGVDTTWNRVPGGAEIGRLTEEAIARFNPADPAASVPALLTIRRRVSGLPTDPVVSDKRQQLDRIIQACIGLEVETVVDRPAVVPGETLKMRHTAVMRSRIPVRWTAVRYPSIQRAITKVLELRANQPLVRDATQILPATTPPTQPYWLGKEGTAGLFHVDDPSLIGRSENPPAFPLEYVFEVGRQTLVISGEPVPAADPANATMRRRLGIIPPVSLRFASQVQLFAPGAARPVTVELTAARARAAGTVQLEAPTGWRITPASQPFRLAGVGEQVRFTFTLMAPVTDEHAPVTFLAPDHPSLTRPNHITTADFDGWVQERGLYFPDQWDERFTAILASGDPGETPLRGGLLVARHGKGYFVYTGLAWFRQLPEGVPGAYRLFANLVSLGK